LRTSIAEQRAEFAEAAGALGNRDGEDRFALLAQLGALGDEAQAIEIHVRARRDRNVIAVARPMAIDKDLEPGDRQCAGRLENRARVLEDVLERRAAGVGVDADDLVDVSLREAERLLADLLHGDAVGKQADVRQDDASAGVERARHRAQFRDFGQGAAVGEKAMLGIACGAVDQPHADIAAEQQCCIGADPGDHRFGQRPDAGNRGDAKHQAGEENAKAPNAAAQLAAREAKGVCHPGPRASRPHTGQRPAVRQLR
jgi:hypothetical protein